VCGDAKRGNCFSPGLIFGCLIHGRLSVTLLQQSDVDSQTRRLGSQRIELAHGAYAKSHLSNSLDLFCLIEQFF
jgi:hypothetical protein